MHLIIAYVRLYKQELSRTVIGFFTGSTWLRVSVCWDIVACAASNVIRRYLPAEGRQADSVKLKFRVTCTRPCAPALAAVSCHLHRSVHPVLALATGLCYLHRCIDPAMYSCPGGCVVPPASLRTPGTPVLVARSKRPLSGKRFYAQRNRLHYC